MSQDFDRNRELMERYAQGEDDVFEELYTLMAPRLYRFCLRLARRKPEADDVFQEAFLRLHRARATYLSGTNPLHWAFAIARSIHLDRLRYRRRRPEQLGSAHLNCTHAQCANEQPEGAPDTLKLQGAI